MNYNIVYQKQDKGVYVYVDIFRPIDNDMLIDEIVSSEWKYMIDLMVYVDDMELALRDYVDENFNDRQRLRLNKYFNEGLKKVLDKW